MYKVCEGGGGLQAGQHTRGDGFSHNKEPEAPSIQCRAVARRRRRLSSGGRVHCHLGRACYVHSSLWVAALAPGSVHLERRREEGNANKQGCTQVPFSFGSDNCAQHSTGHTVFPTAAAAWTREEEQASQRHREKLSTRTMPPGGHVGSRAKRKMKQPQGRSLQHPGGFFALHTRQRQDALQLGRGCGLKRVFQSGSPHC